MNVDEQVLNIIKTLSGLESIDRTHALQNDLGMDSLSMVTLLIEIEEVFNIELKESDMNPFDLETVEDVVSLVKQYGGDSHEQES